jgi:hypothetical protein
MRSAKTDHGQGVERGEVAKQSFAGNLRSQAGAWERDNFYINVCKVKLIFI